MSIRNFLIESVSGSGKTTMAEALARRSYQVIHSDRELVCHGDPQTGEPLDLPPAGRMVKAAEWGHSHWIWPVDKVRSVVADIK